jgi:hypothetical protein
LRTAILKKSFKKIQGIDNMKRFVKNESTKDSKIEFLIIEGVKYTPNMIKELEKEKNNLKAKLKLADDWISNIDVNKILNYSNSSSETNFNEAPTSIKEVS